MLSTKYHIPLIATTDVHAISKEHMEGRAWMQKSKSVTFHDEDDCDLIFKTYESERYMKLERLKIAVKDM